MKTYFSDKGLNNSTITLIEGGNIISEDLEVANTRNIFFEGAVPSLNIHIPEEYICDTTGRSDQIEAIVVKYSSHPSIVNIKTNLRKSTL